MLDTTSALYVWEWERYPQYYIPITDVDPAFLALEREHMWRKSWLYVCHTDQIAQPGSFMMTRRTGAPIIIVRGKDAVIRAFYNTCRHRGSELLEGKGNCKLIVCPYHSWTFELNGCLRGAPEMDKTIGFDKDAYGLHPIKIDTWGGFLFVNFDHDCPPLKQHLGNLPEKLAPYKLEDMALVRRKSYEMPELGSMAVMSGYKTGWWDYKLKYH